MKSKLCIVILSCSLMSCTFFGPKEVRLQKGLDSLERQKMESVQVWQQVAADSLNLNTNKNPFTDLAQLSIRNTQDLVGEPSKEQRIDIEPLFKTNAPARKLVRAELEELEENDILLLREIRRVQDELDVTQDRLVALGKIKEEEQNRVIWWKVTTWSSGTLLVAGIIALCVFFPAAIPIIFGAIKWILSKFVGLIQYIVPAFINTVKGIGNVRATLKAETEANKEIKKEEEKITYKPEEVVKLIDDELNKTQDNHDKRVVAKVREQQNV